MGMYDSFIIDDKCPNCGEELNEIQSKEFNCELNIFRIGDSIISGKKFIDSGYITENLYCYNCKCYEKYKVKLFTQHNKFIDYEFIEIEFLVK